MKKILFVMHNLGHGGAERSMVNLFQELPKDAYHIDLLLFQRKGAFLQQLPEWIHVLPTPDALNGLYGPLAKAGKYIPAKLLGTAWAQAARKTRKSRSAFRWRQVYRRCIPRLSVHYDVAVAYVGSEILYYVQDCVDADRKLVWIHNDYNTAGYSKTDDAPYFEKIDGIVTVSAECEAVLKREFPEYADKISCIENVTSSEAVRKRADASMPEKYDPAGINLLSIGRLWPQKGFDMAIDAAALLKKQGLVFQWFIVGEGFLRDPLQKQIDALGLTEAVHLLGVRDNPYPYLKHCSVMIQSSRYEGKSVVLDEAKILCCPIVVTDYPTAADQIKHGQDGLIVPMSPEGIAQGVLDALDQADTLRGWLSVHEYGNQKETEKYRELLER